MRRLGCLFIIVAVSVMFALATVPGKKSHVRKVASVVSAVMEDENALAGMMRVPVVDAASGINLVERSVDRIMTVEEKMFFSIGMVKWKGEQRVVSFGVFGIVVTAPKELLKEKARVFLSL